MEITVKNKLEKGLYVKERNQKLFAVLVEKLSKAMQLKPEETK